MPNWGRVLSLIRSIIGLILERISQGIQSGYLDMPCMLQALRLWLKTFGHGSHSRDKEPETRGSLMPTDVPERV